MEGILDVGHEDQPRALFRDGLYLVHIVHQLHVVPVWVQDPIRDSWNDHVLDESQYPLVKRIEVENPLEMQRLLDVTVVKC